MPKNKGTYDNSQMVKPLVVLRHLNFEEMDPKTLGMIGASSVGYKWPERSLRWFRDGFVLNDQPRIDGVVREIMASTHCFGVGRTDTEEVLMDELSLKQAEHAVSGAKLTLAVDVDLPKEVKAVKSTKTEAQEIAFSGGEVDELATGVAPEPETPEEANASDQVQE